MADEQIVIGTSEKPGKPVVRQACLYGNRRKPAAIKFPDTIWKRHPTKVIPVYFYIVDGSLQQPLIYAIAESVVALNQLAPCLPRKGKQ